MTAPSPLLPARGYRGFISRAPFTAALIAAIFCTPSAVTFLAGTSSHAAGLTVIAVVAVMVLLPEVRVRLRYDVIAALLTFLVLHFIVARELGATSASRFAGSWVLAAILLTAMQFVAKWLVDLPAASLERALTYLRVLFVIIAVLAAVGLQPPGGPGTNWEKPTFPFTEPSHFAPAFTPLLLAACSSPGWRQRLVWLAIALAIALTLSNLTMLVAVVLIGLVTAPLWQFAVLALAAIPIYLAVDVSYFVERLDFSAHTQNLSALVYIQGMDFIVDATERTRGWGVGFQQLGFSPLHSGASMIIYMLSDGSLNLQDGGFVAAKAISELGVFAMVAIALLTGLAVRGAIRLRASASARITLGVHRRFCLSLVVGYMIDIYVRGVGYFSATSFMLGVALFALGMMRRAQALPAPSLPSSPIASPA